jgi:hypothetical protein
MLTIETQGQRFDCKAAEFHLRLDCCIDAQWRELKTDQLGSLSISADGLFLAPRGKAAVQFFGLNASELITLDIALSHTEFDVKRAAASPLFSLPLFPSMSDFRDLNYSAAACGQSHCSIGNLPPAPLASAQFALNHLQQLSLHAQGSGQWFEIATDKCHEFRFELNQDALPFVIRFFTRSASTDFPGLNRAQVARELRECFTKLYPRALYESRMVGTRGTAKGNELVAVEFWPRVSAAGA